QSEPLLRPQVHEHRETTAGDRYLGDPHGSILGGAMAFQRKPTVAAASTEYFGTVLTYSVTLPQWVSGNRAKWFRLPIMTSRRRARLNMTFARSGSCRKPRAAQASS